MLIGPFPIVVCLIRGLCGFARIPQEKEDFSYRKFDSIAPWRYIQRGLKGYYSIFCALFCGRCQIPCDYILKRSNPLLQARGVLRLLAEEGIEGSGKEAEPRGDGD